MLDLIIPVYNNREGLMRSLMSLGMETKDLYVTIVDDCSSVEYDDIIKMFIKAFPIQYFKLPINSGPGVARQWGLDHTDHDFVAFLDCGDTYTSPFVLQKQQQILIDDSNIYFIISGHNDQRADGFYYIDTTNNRVLGKMYRRSFLTKYHISFDLNCPRINEDVGFNHICRIICHYLEDKDQVAHIYIINDPAVNWNNIGPSIVRFNNCEFYYHQQNLGFALNSEHCLTILSMNKIPLEYFTEQYYAGMAYEYLAYLSTINRRPEFLEDSLTGAAYYYHKVFKSFKDVNKKLLTQSFYQELSDLIQDPEDPIRDNLIPIDFLGFLNKLEAMPCPDISNKLTMLNLNAVYEK